MYLIEAKSPGQWNTESGANDLSMTERYGDSHLMQMSMDINPNSTSNVKHLMNVLDEGERAQQTSTKDGVFSHFYYGLPAHIRDLMRGEFDKNAQDASSVKICQNFTKASFKIRQAAIKVQRIFRLHRQVRLSLYIQSENSLILPM